jgi:hypothetical protein
VSRANFLSLLQVVSSSEGVQRAWWGRGAITLRLFRRLHSSHSPYHHKFHEIPPQKCDTTTKMRYHHKNTTTNLKLRHKNTSFQDELFCGGTVLLQGYKAPIQPSHQFAPNASQYQPPYSPQFELSRCQIHLPW